MAAGEGPEAGYAAGVSMLSTGIETNAAVFRPSSAPLLPPAPGCPTRLARLAGAATRNHTITPRSLPNVKRPTEAPPSPRAVARTRVKGRALGLHFTPFTALPFTVIRFSFEPASLFSSTPSLSPLTVSIRPFRPLRRMPEPVDPEKRQEPPVQSSRLAVGWLPSVLPALAGKSCSFHVLFGRPSPA